MPNIQSAKKRVKVTETKTAKNKALKSALRTSLKKAGTALSANSENKQEVVAAAVKSLDKAVSKGIVHKNNAANKKSGLIKKMNNPA